MRRSVRVLLGELRRGEERGRAEEAERENSGLLTGASNSKGSRRLAVRQDADRDGADTTSTRTTKTATTQSPTPPEFHDAEFKCVDVSMRAASTALRTTVCVVYIYISRLDDCRFALTVGKCFEYYLFENIFEIFIEVMIIEIL